MPTNKEITSAIKRYIDAHPNMKRPFVSLYEMEECAFNCKCTTYQVMVVLQLGSL